MAASDHPHKASIQALRTLILAASPEIREGIKWNAPSYRTTEYFATTNLRVKGGVGIILHLGAKVSDTDITLDDPSQLLKWLGKNRASIEFTGLDDIKTKAAAFDAIIKQWLRHL